VLFEDGKLVAQGSPSEVIARYVQREVNEGSSDVAFLDPLHPEAVGKIRRISVERIDGKAPGVMELTQPFDVLIEYELDRPARDITVGIEIHSEELGMAVISLSDSELENSLLEVRAPGAYSARVRIPDRIFNTGNYYVRIGMVQARRVVDVAEGAAFRIEDNVGIVSAIGHDRKSAVTAVQLPWNIKRLSQH
jgi:lipopolysaccharide transport system ATP-binding protein